MFLLLNENLKGGAFSNLMAPTRTFLYIARILLFTHLGNYNNKECSSLCKVVNLQLQLYIIGKDCFHTQQGLQVEEEEQQYWTSLIATPPTHTNPQPKINK